MKKNKNSIIFLSPVPPPYMGPTIAAEIILKSELNKEFSLIHLDTSDHRELNTLGRLDIQNSYLALKHYAMLILLIIKHCPAIIYIPISQTTMGYLRDVGFILISKLFARKVICHLRGGNFRSWYKYANPIMKFIVRRMHALIDGQMVLGEKLRILFEGIIPEEKIFVVPNGKNVEVNLNKKGLSRKKRIIYLSNFSQDKGIFIVLESLRKIFQSFPDIEFIFAGSCHDFAVKRKIEMFVAENPDLPIIIKGPILGRAKYDLLCSSDIFVFTPIQQEGHPWVIIEAMACELPIITTDKGAITESVKNGINGFVINDRSPDQIAEKIKFLLGHPQLMEKMRKESRKLYLEKFTEKRMIEKLIEVFHTVLYL